MRAASSLTVKQAGRVALNHPLDHHVLDAGNRLGRVQALGAGFGAVHDGMATVQLERVFQFVQPLARRLVPAVNDPAVGVQQCSGAKIAVAIPPIAGAGC